MTAAALASENKALSHPHSVDSLPTSANQKTTSQWLRQPDVVCGRWPPIPVACWRWNGWRRVRIDLREGLKSSSQLEQARHVLREHVTHYDDDRFFAPDIDKAMQLLEEGRLVGLLPSVL